MNYICHINLNALDCTGILLDDNYPCSAHNRENGAPSSPTCPLLAKSGHQSLFRRSSPVCLEMTLKFLLEALS